MNQPAPRCPACGAADPLFSARRQVYVCEDCGHRWPLPTQARSLNWPDGLAPNDLPIWLAAPLAALLEEVHPRVRLQWLVECTEVALRWTVAVTFAQVVHANTGVLPTALAGRIREHIERPTLGRWLGILQALTQARPSADLPAPAFFDLHASDFGPRFRSEGQGGALQDSLLALRNHLAHGAGLRTVAASALLESHQPGAFDLLRAVATAGAGTSPIMLDGAEARVLTGLNPAPIPRPAALTDQGDGPWLIGAAGAAPLLPLADFGPVHLIGGNGQLERCHGDPAAQLYQRAERDRLAYVPFGRDEPLSFSFDVQAFRALFRLDAEPTGGGATSGGPYWDDFLREARVLAEDLVGRAAELATLKAWLRGRDSRRSGVAAVGLVTGGPGVGKSLLLARLAADQGNARPDRQALYYHRFRAGDARNSTRAFLVGLLAALGDWPLLPPPATPHAGGADPDTALLEMVRGRLAAVAELAPTRPGYPPPRLLVLADGLDEVLPAEPLLPRRLRELALPGTVWLLASRPEPALTRAFGDSGCEPLFLNGLPPMASGEIRAMLMEGLANARPALIARDEDSADAVRNPFVERVVACADGLPLYVRLLLEDLRNGRFTVHDEDRLPRGLVAYYDALMERVGLSDLKRDLPLVIACLARAEAPLDMDALALLLADLPADAPRYHERARQAARAGEALLRGAPTPDGGTGRTLYHQSFRDYLSGRPPAGDRPGTPPAAALAGTLRDAEAKLCRLADGWADLPAGNLRCHLFRWGVRYALRWQGADGLTAARRRLTDFRFLQAATAELPASAIRGLVADYGTVLARVPDGPERDGFRLWEAFFREREHLLRRGRTRWSAHKILLQLAVEHADDSPLTAAAEAWLAAGHCNWAWLRNPQRVARAAPDPCLRVLEGHTALVRGALTMPDGRILSWSEDRTLRLWDWRTGELHATFVGHTGGVVGAFMLADGRFASWSWDNTLSPDHTLRIWSPHSSAALAILAGHTNDICGALPLPDGRILSWSADTTLRIWDATGATPPVILCGHRDSVREALPLSDGRILSCSDDGDLHLWDGHSGALLATLIGHKSEVWGALVLPDGRILSWSRDGTLRLWDGKTGAPLSLRATREGFRGRANSCR